MTSTTAGTVSNVRLSGRRAATLGAVVLASAAAVVLPVLPASAASFPVTPAFTCAAANTDGTYTYFYSYTNSSASTFNLPPFTRNDLIPGSVNTTLPTSFSPGTHSAFSVTTTKGTVRWRLDTQEAVGDSTILCSGQAVVAESWSPLLLPAAAILPFGVWFRRNRRRQTLTPTQ